MQRLFAFAIFGAVLALAGCGGGTCSGNGSVAVTEVTNGCTTLAANEPVTIALHACPTCSDTNLRCVLDGDPASGTFLLDSQANQCTSDCPGGCSINPVQCQIGPLAPGSYTVLYNTAGSPGSKTINAQAGGATSCTL
jgi:hypothetical protein